MSVKGYQRRKLWAATASAVVSIAWLGLLAVVVGPKVGLQLREFFGVDPWPRLIWMAALTAVSLEAVTLPIDFWSGFIVEHRHQLSNQSLPAWIVRRLKGYLVGGVLGLALVCGLYAVFWRAGTWWWIWATAGWLIVTLVLGRLVPVLILPLFYKMSRLEDDSLLGRLRLLCEGTGMTIEGVYRLHLSAETRKANAALAGLGKTRRVLLGDTLLDSFTPKEIEIVFAHEVGHHVHRHLSKNVAIRVTLSLVGFGLVDFVLRATADRIGYDGMTDPAALPLLLLVLTIFGLLLAPLQNAISRAFEVQCDLYALERTGDREAYRSAFLKLAETNKSDLDPHPLVVWFFYDHPPIRARLALARGDELPSLSD